jgi:elongator complex protein 1
LTKYAGVITSAEYAFSIAHGSLSPPHDYGAVAVIDGTLIKLTAFRTANIPPPMSMFELELDQSVIDIAFSQNNSTIAALHQSGVDLFQWNVKGDRSVMPTLVGRTSFDKSTVAGYPLQICFSGEDQFVILVSAGLLKAHSFTFDTNEGSAGASSILQIAHMSTIIAYSDSRGSDGSLLQDSAGQLYKLANGIQHSLHWRFPSQLPWVEARQIEGSLVAFGLSRNGHLYANSRLLVKNCTSFLVTPSHLVFTTNNHLVKFAHLTAVEGKPESLAP